MDTSLSNLHPIIESGAVAWWPPAPGWYGVLALLVLFLIWRCLLWLRAWRAERYRRQALKELSMAGDAQSVARLLKRTALSAFRREQVADLSGPAWHEFLDKTCGQTLFAGTQGELLDRASYGSAALPEPEFIQLRAAAAAWVRQHVRE